MKIAATAVGQTLDADFDPKFGRCHYFLIVDTDDMTVECLDNPHRHESSGVGSKCVQLMADRAVTTLLTGDVGPHARQALEASGITVVTGCVGRIAETVAGLTASRSEDLA